MKTFLAACVILAILIGGIVANGIFVHRQLNEIIDLTLRLPDTVFTEDAEYEDISSALQMLWSDTCPIASVTVSAAHIENIERTFGDLTAAWQAGDDAMYRQSRAELLLLLRRLRTAEALSLDGVI